jgi:hypothetical protein
MEETTAWWEARDLRQRMPHFENVRTKPPDVIKIPATTTGQLGGSWNFTRAMTCAVTKNKTT